MCIILVMINNQSVNYSLTILIDTITITPMNPFIKNQARWNIQRRLRRCDRFSRAFLGLLAYDQQPGVEKTGETGEEELFFIVMG